MLTCQMHECRIAKCSNAQNAHFYFLFFLLADERKGVDPSVQATRGGDRSAEANVAAAAKPARDLETAAAV